MFAKLNTASEESLTGGLLANPMPRIVAGTNDDDFILITDPNPTVVLGYGGDDTISFYGDADHTTYAGSGNDTVNINGGGDVTAIGGTGDDHFNVNSKENHDLDGGAGHDIGDFRGLTGYGTSDYGFRFDLGAGTVRDWTSLPWSAFQVTFENIEEIYGSYWDDLFIGSNEADIVHGVGGFDTFYGNGGDDVFYASADGSIAYGWQDDDHLIGDRGEDEFHGGNGDDTLDGGAGDDELNGDAGDDVIYGGEGEDVITAGTGSDQVYAGDDWDTVYATASHYDHDRDPDYYNGGEGRDTLSYANSDIAVYISTHFGVAGALIDGQTMGLDSFTGFETFEGSRYDDFIRTNNAYAGDFGPFREIIFGGEGDDTVYASKGDDIYHGDEGDDTVDFSGMYSSVLIDFDDAGPYQHDARIGDDIYQLRDFEHFVGGRVDDTFIGNDEDHAFEGWRGNDTATGGGGEDTFIFRDNEGGFGFDRVTDYTEGEDMILLDGLHRWDGTAVKDWADLDTNGDDVVGYGDDSTFVTAEGTMLLFDEGTVMLEGHDGVAVDGFLFA